MARNVAKLSVSLPREDVQWLKKRAEKAGEKSTLSALLSEAVRRLRQQEARQRVFMALAEGWEPSEAELLAVRRERL